MRRKTMRKVYDKLKFGAEKKRAVLQIDGEHDIGNDADGNPRAEIPEEGLNVWIQDKDGNPLDGERYMRLTIFRDGTVKKTRQ